MHNKPDAGVTLDSAPDPRRVCRAWPATCGEEVPVPGERKGAEGKGNASRPKLLAAQIGRAVDSVLVSRVVAAAIRNAPLTPRLRPGTAKQASAKVKDAPDRAVAVFGLKRHPYRGHALRPVPLPPLTPFAPWGRLASEGRREQSRFA